MKLATVRTADGWHVVRVEPDRWIDLGPGDVGELLGHADWPERAAAARDTLVDADPSSVEAVVPRPGKIICVGLNYRTHIIEMGRDLPQFPTLFAKFPEALLGPYDTLDLPPDSDQVDWEAELAVVVGRPVHRADRATAQAAIAGYTIINDVTMRDWQFRTREWLQGKTWEATAPLGPYLVTPDELAPDAAISCIVDGEIMQKSTIADLLFGPAELISYVSRILTLNPGDVIATGTTGGVGHARTPPRYLRPGQTLVTRIEGIGETVTPVRRSGEGTRS